MLHKLWLIGMGMAQSRVIGGAGLIYQHTLTIPIGNLVMTCLLIVIISKTFKVIFGARLKQVCGTYGLVVFCWMVLGKVVCLVVFSWFPVDVKLSLAHSVSGPVESHIHSLGSLLLDAVCEDANGCGVVSLNWGWRLGVTHILECLPHVCNLFAIVE